MEPASQAWLLGDWSTETEALANESKKEAFRKYLEAHGVLDSLTKALVALYEEPEKPVAALEFIRSALGGPTVAEYEQVKAQRDELRSQLDQLQTRYNGALKQIDDLRKGKPAQGSPAGVSSGSGPSPTAGGSNTPSRLGSSPSRS